MTNFSFPINLERKSGRVQRTTVLGVSSTFSFVGQKPPWSKLSTSQLTIYLTIARRNPTQSVYHPAHQRDGELTDFSPFSTPQRTENSPKPRVLQRLTDLGRARSKQKLNQIPNQNPEEKKQQLPVNFSPTEENILQY